MLTINNLNYLCAVFSKSHQYISECMPLGKMMAAITKSYYGALSKRVEKFGIDRHFSTLITIDTTKEKCTQQYLSDFLNIDKVTMVRNIDYLVKKNMIRRVINPIDRREHIITLTDKAKKIMPLIHNEIENMNNIALKGFNKEQTRLFKEQISSIINNLENLPVNEVSIKFKK